MAEDSLRTAVRRLWFVVFVAAVADAVRNRRRHGEVLGFVPYDFRLPTVDRACARTWNPGSPRIFTPATFGIGWSVNLGRLARLAGLT